MYTHSSEKDKDKNTKRTVETKSQDSPNGYVKKHLKWCFFLRKSPNQCITAEHA